MRYSVVNKARNRQLALGRLDINANLLHEFTGKIGDRPEDAAGHGIAFDFAKPDFDLLQPR
jgi:hypothetical protein